LIGVATAGAIYALYDSSDAHHIDFVRLFQRSDLSILAPDFVLPEADFLIRRHLGASAQADFLEGLAAGFFTVEPTTAVDWKQAARLIREHSALRLGLTEATVVAAAERLNAQALLTADDKRFRPIRSAKRLVLLPADL
jgi:predicted nucleic acid-binding protein